jgi:hypothetical protein
MDVLHEDIDKEKLRSIVEKKLGEGKPLDYSNALYRVIAYNKENPFS